MSKSLHQSINQPINQSINLSVCLSFYLSTYLPIYLSIYLTYLIYLSIYLYIYIYLFIYLYIHTYMPYMFLAHGSVAPPSPPNGMVAPPPHKIHHLHAICSISESRLPICLQFAAFQSHNLRLASYLQHLKAICYVHTTYVPFIVSICFFFYLVYLYTSQAIAYLHTAHQLPMISILPVLYPYIYIYNLYATVLVA